MASAGPACLTAVHFLVASSKKKGNKLRDHGCVMIQFTEGLSQLRSAYSSRSDIFLEDGKLVEFRTNYTLHWSSAMFGLVVIDPNQLALCVEHDIPQRFSEHNGLFFCHWNMFYSKQPLLYAI